jgi:membrane fusion protein, heavy metal efflux system
MKTQYKSITPAANRPYSVWKGVLKNMVGLAMGLFILLSQPSCGSKPAAETTPPNGTEEASAADEVTLNAAQYASAGVQIGKIETRMMSGLLTANGLLDVPPQNLVSISAPFGGYLRQSTLLPGTRVAKGQKIAVLEHPDFVTMQQAYLEDKSSLGYLEAEYQRQLTLSEANVNARKSVEKAKAEFESMKARVNGQRTKLQMLNISISQLDAGTITSTVELFSPIAGYVTQMNVNIGAYAHPSDAIFRIADTEHLHAELSVYESDIAKLAIGQKVRVRLGNETKERPATIHLIGREVGQDRTVKIHVHFDQEDPSLIPGTYLQAEIEAMGHETLALPEAAVLDFEGKHYVFFELPNRGGDHAFRLVEVVAGLTNAGFVEVGPIAGQGDAKFDPKGTVVVSGGHGLLAKLKNTEDD